MYMYNSSPPNSKLNTPLGNLKVQCVGSVGLGPTDGTSSWGNEIDMGPKIFVEYTHMYAQQYDNVGMSEKTQNLPYTGMAI